MAGPEGREEPLRDPPGGPYRYTSVAVSPDGATLAVKTFGFGPGGPDASKTGPIDVAPGMYVKYGRMGVWTYDRERQALSPIAVGRNVTIGSLLWTPDGRNVVYTAIPEGSYGLYRRNADGTGEEELLFTDPDANRLVAVGWIRTPDGDSLVAMKSNSRRKFHLLSISMADRSVTELPLESAGLDASISPDGRWVAYSSNRSGRREVYVERFPELTERRLVSTEGGQQPLWSNGGEELYYLDPDRNRVMVVAVTSGRGLELGRPKILAERPVIAKGFNDPGHSYAVAPDRRLLMLTPDENEPETEASEITVVLNWFSELERLVPSQ